MSSEPVFKPRMREEVVARCHCGWESEPKPIKGDIINGEWFARQAALDEYCPHFIEHRPPPTFIKREVSS